MKNVLTDIQSGRLPATGSRNQAGRPVYNALKRQGEDHLIEKVGKELRGMMAWLHK